MCSRRGRAPWAAATSSVFWDWRWMSFAVSLSVMFCSVQFGSVLFMSCGLVLQSAALISICDRTHTHTEIQRYSHNGSIMKWINKMAAYAQPPPLRLELKLCIKFNAACGNIKPNFIVIVMGPSTNSILYHLTCRAKWCTYQRQIAYCSSAIQVSWIWMI